jgi:hypothetical protein
MRMTVTPLKRGYQASFSRAFSRLKNALSARSTRTEQHATVDQKHRSVLDVSFSIKSVACLFQATKRFSFLVPSWSFSENSVQLSPV